MKTFSILLDLLQNRKEFIAEICQGVKITNKILGQLIVSFILLAIYGVIIGSNHSFLQAFSSALKLPALYLITLLICLPPLYFFNILSGSRCSLSQYLAMLLTGVSVTSVILFSLAPITLFFGISLNSYKFFQLFNVAIFAIAGLIGVNYLYQAMKFFYEQESGNQAARMNILRFWLALYAFVGSQLGWTLRPFFGTPGNPFQLFRSEIESNFYLHILHVLGFPVK
jgi:hypothetical protein